MGALDDHNRQHTYGNTMGMPTSVAGVSAQQAIDNHQRLVTDAPRSHASSGRAAGARPLFRGALVAAGLCLAAAIAAATVGGIGAVALSLLAFVAGMFGAVFLVMGLIQAAKGQRS